MSTPVPLHNTSPPTSPSITQSYLASLMSTSSETPSARLAARERRRKEREAISASSSTPQTTSSTLDSVDDSDHVEWFDAEGRIAVPRLRVNHGTSESTSPSITNSPFSTSSYRFHDVQEPDYIPRPAPTPSSQPTDAATVPSTPSNRPKSRGWDIAEIPAWKPPTRTPSPSATPQIAGAFPPTRSTTPVATATSEVTVADGGALARLKAMRAIKRSGSPASTSVSPVGSPSMTTIGSMIGGGEGGTTTPKSSPPNVTIHSPTPVRPSAIQAFSTFMDNNSINSPPTRPSSITIAEIPPFRPPSRTTPLVQTTTTTTKAMQEPPVIVEGSLLERMRARNRAKKEAEEAALALALGGASNPSPRTVPLPDSRPSSIASSIRSLPSSPRKQPPLPTTTSGFRSPPPPSPRPTTMDWTNSNNAPWSSPGFASRPQIIDSPTKESSLFGHTSPLPSSQPRNFFQTSPDSIFVPPPSSIPISPKSSIRTNSTTSRFAASESSSTAPRPAESISASDDFALRRRLARGGGGEGEREPLMSNEEQDRQAKEYLERFLKRGEEEEEEEEEEKQRELRGFEFHELSDVSEHSDQPTVSRHSRQPSSSSIGASSTSSIFGGVPHSTSVPRPISSSRRQLADGTFQPPPSISTQPFSKEATSTARILASGLKGVRPMGPAPVLESMRGGKMAGSEVWEERKRERGESPTRRMSPEVARRARAFEDVGGGGVGVEESERVFGKKVEEEEDGVRRVREEGWEEREREERRRREREERRKEREEMKIARGVTVAASDKSIRSFKEDDGNNLVAGDDRPASIVSSSPQRRHLTTTDNPKPTSSSPSIPIHDSIIHQGPILSPPRNLTTNLSSLDLPPSSWKTYYAVLTVDTLEFRPTDTSGPFTPEVVLYPIEIVRVQDRVDGAKIPMVVVMLWDAEVEVRSFQMLGFRSAKEKVDWVLALEDASRLAKIDPRSAESILNDGTPRTPPVSSSGKRSPLPPPSPLSRTHPLTTKTTTSPPKPSSIHSIPRSPDKPLPSAPSFESDWKSAGKAHPVFTRVQTASTYPDDVDASSMGRKESIAPTMRTEEEVMGGGHQDLFGKLRETGRLEKDGGGVGKFGSPRKVGRERSTRDVFGQEEVPRSTSHDRHEHTSPLHSHSRSRSELSPISSSKTDNLHRPTPRRIPPPTTTHPDLSFMTHQPSPTSYENISRLEKVRNKLEQQDIVTKEGETGAHRFFRQVLKGYVDAIERIDEVASRREGEVITERENDTIEILLDALEKLKEYPGADPEDIIEIDSILKHQRSFNRTIVTSTPSGSRSGSGAASTTSTIRSPHPTHQHAHGHAQTSPTRKHVEKKKQKSPFPQAEFDTITQTTRAGIHTPSEARAWKADMARFAQEAQNSSTSSQASPATMSRHRAIAESRLEGRTAPNVDPSLPLDPTLIDESLVEAFPPRSRLQQQQQASVIRQVSPTRSAYPAAREEQRLPKTASQILRERFEGKDPFARSVDQLMDRGRERPVELSQWSATTAGDPFRQTTSSKMYDQPTQDYGEPGKPLPRPVKPMYPRAQPGQAPYQPVAGPSSAVGSFATDHEALQLLKQLRTDFAKTGRFIESTDKTNTNLSAFVNQLADFMAEDRATRQKNFDDLVNSVQDLRSHLDSLPHQLLSQLQNTQGLLPPEQALPDVDHGQWDPVVVATTGDDDEPIAARDGPTTETSTTQDPAAAVASRFGINPLSSFAQLDRKMAGLDTGKGKIGTIGKDKPKGPRMPGMKLWGGPTPVSVEEHALRWGGHAAAVAKVKDQALVDEVLAADAEASKPKHGPLVEAIKTDEGLADALQNLATGGGADTPIDAATMAMAVFEILQSMRETAKREAEKVKRKAEEQEKNGGLSKKERIELEAKKEEIKRLETIAEQTANRQIAINDTVAALSAKTQQTESLLQQIAKEVSSNKPMTMDPALTDEARKLLNQVKSGVDDHVKDFRGQLTSEVQRMFQEVGKLRDEKKTLQQEISDLMSFQAKQGGGGGGAKPAGAKAAPLTPAAAPEVKAVPGMPSVGFFGPRAPK